MASAIPFQASVFGLRLIIMIATTMYSPPLKKGGGRGGFERGFEQREVMHPPIHILHSRVCLEKRAPWPGCV